MRQNGWPAGSNTIRDSWGLGCSPACWAHHHVAAVRESHFAAQHRCPKLSERTRLSAVHRYDARSSYRNSRTVIEIGFTDVVGTMACGHHWIGNRVSSTTSSRSVRERHSSGSLTAFSLIAIAALHVAWGLGSSFPFQSREELADSVIGTDEVPSLPACLAVASLLALTAALVVDLVPLPNRLRRFALRIASAVLATRGVAGAVGRTSTLSPGSDSPAFVRLDKKVYAPLCLWLAAGVRRST